MKAYFSYRWNAVNLNTECSKCGNNIVFQDVEGNPTCNECGNVNKISWISILKKVDIVSMLRSNSEKKKLMGAIDASVSLELIEKISCSQCKTELLVTDETDLKNYSCPSCKIPISFKEESQLEDLVFYKAGNQNSNHDTIKMIAVRCVSCGAPLEVDPSINNFHCKFCSTDNILPMSLRYKVVLDDILVGEKMSRFPKLLVFEQDGKIVKQALNENGKSSFADAELDKVLIEKKDDAGVYNIITNDFKYLPPDKILNQIFDTSTNQTIVGLVGTRLQKTKEEIESRIQVFAPKPQQKEKEAKVYYQQPAKKSFFKTPLFYIILVLTIVSLVIMATNI